MDTQRLREIREGRRGVALALYIEIDDEDWEDYCLTIPTVLALGKGTGKQVLDVVRSALDDGSAEEISDDASDAVNIVLASALKDQILVARMLDSVCGRPDDSEVELAPALATPVGEKKPSSDKLLDDLRVLLNDLDVETE